jgi:putative peptidoglycan lipid II flippase
MTTERDETSGNYFNIGHAAPEVSVGNRRYRLLTPHGGHSLLRFWQGLDVASGHEVALTIIDPDSALPEEFVHEILARTAPWARR